YGTGPESRHLRSGTDRASSFTSALVSWSPRDTAANIAATTEPAETPDALLNEYPASMSATMAPTSPMNLTPPPDNTTPAGLRCCIADRSVAIAASLLVVRRNPLVGKEFPVERDHDAIAGRM